MTFNETLERIREIGRTTDVSDKNFMAVQVNLTGEDTGVFYDDFGEGFYDEAISLTEEIV